MESKNTSFNKKAKEVYKKYKEKIHDIIIFGSYMKGKYNPNDIDLLIIFKNEINKEIEVELKNKINNPKIDLNSVTLKELENESFIAKEGLYLEGKSLITNISLSESIGFSSIAFLKYNLNKIKGSERVKFYYALQGRGTEKGFLNSIKAKKYSETVIICDYQEIEKLKEFLSLWKIEYQLTPALIPKRLKKIIL